jgi:Cu/Ag efflux pump CusA
LEKTPQGASSYSKSIFCGKVRNSLSLGNFVSSNHLTPLAVSTGAGANSRHSIGTGVMGGMVGATVLGVLFVPVFYVVVRRLLGDKTDQTG